MAEPLKNLYSQELIKSLSREIKKHYSKFNLRGFNRKVLDTHWTSLELKQRMRHISVSLGQYLPQDFPQAIDILLPVSDCFSGLEHMLFADFVEMHGVDDFSTSMRALEHFTVNSSSEFAIRPFFIKYPKQTLKQMIDWSRSDNYHVRRLASEGSRPRLPWAMALPEFKKDPTDILVILENLIDDKILYVRRSVANNLNDISKDNSQIVVEFARRYLGQSEDVDWVIKHACRSLLKQGDKRVLPLFGYSDANHVKVRDFKSDTRVSLGEKLNFEFEIESQQSLGKLRLEFVIDFRKANGRNAPKIFKISEGEYHGNSKRVAKCFSFKPITTRKYYPGEHFISLVINGNRVTTKPFELVG